MIYSRSAEYGIRALVHLCQVPEGQFTMAKVIAQKEDIPAHFLAKILQQLTRKGMLRSSKGPTGGFVLRRKASEIMLMDVVEALDGRNEYEKCISGLAECNDAQPCGMHDAWAALRSRILDYLEKTSIADVAEALEMKKRALARPRGRKSSATSD